MGQADLWVNGVQVATATSSRARSPSTTSTSRAWSSRAPTRSRSRCTRTTRAAMLTQDFNDWTQTARDQNTGIKYPVRLHVSNALQLSDVHVDQNNAADMSSSDLTVKGTVKNTSARPRPATSTRRSRPQAGQPDQRARDGQPRRRARARRRPPFDPRCTSTNPKLWWPYQMGDQPLYQPHDGGVAGRHGLRHVVAHVRHPHDQDLPVGAGHPAPTTARAGSRSTASRSCSAAAA